MARTAPIVCPIYIDRWFGGTREMSPAARAIYMDFLLRCWEKNTPLPPDERTQCMIGRCTPAELHEAWNEMRDKWTRVEGGFVSEPLEAIRLDNLRYYASQREKAKKAAAARWGKDAPSNTPSMPPSNAPDHALDLSFSRSLDLPNLGLEDMGETEDRDEQKHTDHADADRARAREEPAVAGAPEEPESTTAPAWRLDRREQAGRSLINGGEMRRHQAQHAWCSERICVPNSLHEDFKRRGLKTDDELKSWYASVLEKYRDQPFGDDEYPFWRNEFAHWLGLVTTRAVAKKAPTSDPATGAMSAIFAQRNAARRKRGGYQSPR